MTGWRNRKWFPLGVTSTRGLPDIGALVAWDHAVYRVREIREIPPDLRQGDQVSVILRPVRFTGDDPKLRRHDLHVRTQRRAVWCDVYPDDHYPVCAKCGEPVPCRETEARKQADFATQNMIRYEMPGVCPACQEPVTARQGSRTFEENCYVPLGPPVTFHTRAKCRDSLSSYEDDWVAADPGNRQSTRPPRCPGTATVHGDSGTYECTEGATCPGLVSPHEMMRGCSCAGHTRGFRLPYSREARNLAMEQR